MTSPIGKLGPRYDKYDPISGGFRARVAEAWTAAEVGKVFGVAIDTNGRVIRGGVGDVATTIVGVVVVQEPKAIGDVVDVMTSGEIADVFTLNDGSTATTAGTSYYAAADDGAITATSTSNKLIGRLLEKDGRDRLVVRVTW